MLPMATQAIGDQKILIDLSGFLAMKSQQIAQRNYITINFNKEMGPIN